VVMQGADIGAGAIVARSVVPPGARVPAGARIIDEVYASLSSDGRGES
jgi:ADP-glucose pyrophosphorylase